ncbi:MAG: hypothetical protein LUG96_01910 [Tannerellaceae bacterium]|nr:hypothetical protein [Tannerellaceae bacterium]
MKKLLLSFFMGSMVLNGYAAETIVPEDIKSITVDKTSVREGDTVTLEIEMEEAASGNVDLYSVIEVDENGEQVDEVIATSETSSVSFVVEHSMRIKVVVSNETELAISDQTIEITAISGVKVVSIGYSISNTEEEVVGGDHLDGQTEVSFTVNAQERVVLVVNTNWSLLEDIEEEVEFKWTKDGEDVPANVTVEEAYLIIESFDTDTHNGVYECVVSDNGKQKAVVYFAINTDLPTDNEVIVASQSMYVSNGYLYLDQVSSSVKVYNINGSLVKTIPANSGNVIPLNLPKGIYVITNGKDVVKAII